MTSRRRIIFILNDLACLVFALTAAIWLRFETLEPQYVGYLYLMLPVVAPATIAVFWLWGLYNRTLRFTSIPDLVAVFAAVTLGSMLKMTFIFFQKGMDYSHSVIILDWMLNLLLIGSSRIAPRLLLNIAEYEPIRTYVYGELKSPQKRILIVGAGRAGESVVREIRRNENLPYNVIGFIDDDPTKMNQIIHGAMVLGTRQELAKIVIDRLVDEIIIAIPSASGKVLREIVKLCRDTRVRFKTLPSMQDLIDGKLVGLQLRDIAIEDLLRRPPAEINLAEIAAFLTDRVVLITGAGGSIGSEICRQIIPFKPRKLLLFGHGENSIYTIHQELLRSPELGDCRLVPLLGDIQDIARLKQVFSTHSPRIVFHAAAHKHVPMMEENPEEAIKNNVLGTANLVQVAHEAKVERFVMISTDKAVNPTSVMGVTKRVAEMTLKAFAKKSATRFVAVRFGNVLGSRGSVIPVFKRQIEAGGPVTITHPNMIRYFMTIPEASKLVIQAGAYGKGGEVFVLDMGDPVKIVDLATDIIRLAGLEVDKDIKLEFTGVRPGEKLYEELLTADEGITATRNKKIFIAKPEEVDEERLMPEIKKLVTLAQAGTRRRIIDQLSVIVPSFSPDRDKVFNDARVKVDRSAQRPVETEAEDPPKLRVV